MNKVNANFGYWTNSFGTTDGYSINFMKLGQSNDFCKVYTNSQGYLSIDVYKPVWVYCGSGDFTNTEGIAPSYDFSQTFEYLLPGNWTTNTIEDYSTIMMLTKGGE